MAFFQSKLFREPQMRASGLAGHSQFLLFSQLLSEGTQILCLAPEQEAHLCRVRWPMTCLLQRHVAYRKYTLQPHHSYMCLLFSNILNRILANQTQ